MVIEMPLTERSKNYKWFFCFVLSVKGGDLLWNQSINFVHIKFEMFIWYASGNDRYVVRYIGVKEGGPGKTHTFGSRQCISKNR